MECENVFNAASDGNLYELKQILENKPKDEVVELVSAFTNGCTPLIVASRNGDLDIVIYLLEKCYADVKQVGSARGVTGTALTCAVWSGHLNIVKMLIKYKASVNGIEGSRGNSPLVAAILSDELEIGKYLIEHGADIELSFDVEQQTCLFNASSMEDYEFTKYLLHCGADVNGKSVHGHTALHACLLYSYPDGPPLEIIKLLLEHGAVMCKDDSGETPLILAALNGFASIVEYFIKEYNCTKQEKIDALELLGAALVDLKDMVAVRNYWRRAMELRYEDSSFLLEKPETISPMSFYISAEEWRSLDQLNQLDDDEMEIQSLLVIERIQGPCHFTVSSRARTYAETGNFERCIQLLRYALDAVLDKEQITAVYSAVLDFTEMFYLMFETWDVAKDMPAVSIRDVVYVLENVMKEMKRSFNGSENKGMDISTNRISRKIFITAMHLVNLMCKLRPYLNRNEDRSLKEAVYKLVCMNLKGKNGYTLLHFASFKGPKPIFRLPNNLFPSKEVVDLFLEVGACPNAVDFNNNTPLHIAAISRPFDANVFYSLLNQGAHFDLHNNKNQTPIQLVPADSLLNINPLQYLNLQCMCANEINKHRIYYKGFVPEKLCKFIELHGLH